MTGSGDGHSHGQYAGESASRSRWPAGIAWAIAVELERHARSGCAGLERLRVLVAVAVGEVEHAARDEQRGAVGRHVAQPRGELRHRPVALELELHARVAEQLDRAPPAARR